MTSSCEIYIQIIIQSEKSPKRYFDFLYKIIVHSLKIHDSDDEKNPLKSTYVHVYHVHTNGFIDSYWGMDAGASAIICYFH